MSNVTQAKVQNWSFQEHHVQPSIDDYGSFIRAGSVLLAAGPAKLTSFILGNNVAASGEEINVGAAGLDFAHPLGVVENLALAQNKQLQTIFEIGSDRRYFIPGRTVNNLSLSRVLMDGPSLLKMAMAGYLGKKAYESTNANDLTDIVYATDSSQANRRLKIKNMPGYDHMFLNLASELFNLPIGLLILFKNSVDGLVACSYLEKCMISSHNMNVNASSVLVAEAINIQFDRVMPINLLGTVADGVF